MGEERKVSYFLDAFKDYTFFNGEHSGSGEIIHKFSDETINVNFLGVSSSVVEEARSALSLLGPIARLEFLEDEIVEFDNAIVFFSSYDQARDFPDWDRIEELKSKNGTVCQTFVFPKSIYGRSIGEIKTSYVYVNENFIRRRLSSCIRHETLHALGMLGDTRNGYPSILDTRTARVEYSEQDLLILTGIYSNIIRPGQTKKEALNQYCTFISGYEVKNVRGGG
jgi:hypothetical protein